jgi:fatty acid desaturase
MAGMAYALAETAEIGGMEEASPAARNLVPPAVLAGLSRRSDLRGALRLSAHAGCIGATGLLVWLALPVWYLLVPAMALHGFSIVTLFAPMHECVHRTAFASRRANEIVAWVAGVMSFYNSTFYWHFHSWHHRYTQDPDRDPELMFPKAASRLEYLREVSSFNFWFRRLLDYPRLALGLVRNLPFMPESARRSVALSMLAQLLIYLAALIAIAFGLREVLYFWFLPVLLAQPLLRAVLIAEHTGCSQDRNGLTNTRTTLASFPIRLLMWNMPYHAEHHLYPAIPFYRLPALHREVRAALRHIAPGYVAANREILQSL